jgi:predicted AAA+ superfamily ATPase
MSDYDSQYYKKIVSDIEKLLLYRAIRKDDIVRDLRKICKQMSNNEKHLDLDKLGRLYYDMCSKLIIKAEHHSFSGNILKQYIMYLFFYDENLYTLHCEKYASKIETSLYQAALSDIRIMSELMNFDISVVAKLVGSTMDIENYNAINQRTRKYEQIFLNAETASEKAAAMGEHYNKFGCGQLAEYSMFRWDNEKGLKAISNCDDIKLCDLIGYEYQKNELMNNTQAFIKGYPANNVLLVGARGTGKSSAVKALANEYFEQGLRLLEISKEQIIEFPQILKYISQRGRKFIIFLDDLSFDDFEIEYKYMKSLLEGSTEKKPDNVLFYATSNRRHIIQEKWSDRAGNPNDDVHTADALNEKISLSDRFGLTISYSAPNQKEYLDMVESIANKEGLEYNKEELYKAAIAWEISQKGRSGRTARQFINSYCYKK